MSDNIPSTQDNPQRTSTTTTTTTTTNNDTPKSNENASD